MAGRVSTSRSSRNRVAKRAPKGASVTSAPTGKRAERRRAILAAALQEFSAQGFAAARLDDVAQSAGIAKGTIYLYFRDKEGLFQELIRTEISPVVGALQTALALDLPVRTVAERALALFVREIYGTDRKDILRLIISEGPRFPKIADFYYREVLGRVVPAVRALLTRALERGELRNDALIRFPQLLAAPGIVAIIWNGLFSRHDPLDIGELMRAHLDLVFGDGASR